MPDEHAEAPVTATVAADHGLSADEFATILSLLGRTPNLTELGIFSAMWSEHCSYKSSKKWLRMLPTAAPWVICGPGENAGVIDIGDGDACIFKMESHNHPSYIEPYQGAATGVGGILRDVFTMGARPIASLNALRFGSPEHPKTRHLVAGVVGGIGGYGNCVGVPTVGGECTFHPGYDGNILVNAMSVGIARADRIFYSAAAGVGNALLYVGSKTGRDGIHGASMASAEFSDDAEAKRPTVQVGDPFAEKLLIEACLELMATDAIIAIQDMGAAGLTSSSFEMASKGGVGVDLDLDQVPQREPGMSAYEIMLSESQERMLMVVRPGREDVARRVFEKWELEVATVGRLTDTGRMVVRHRGHIVADLPIDPLAAAAPEYSRPWVPTVHPARAHFRLEAQQADPIAVLTALLRSPDLGSKRWIWEQYDHMVGASTVQRPGGDAAVVRLPGTTKALAMTSDCTPRYCRADPLEGGRQAVAEAWRNLTAVGARPLALTDCLNFGNPQRPEVMGQLVGCLSGMAEACRVLDFPVVSGNVSLYNENNGVAIPPTPTIGGVGLIADVERMAGIALGNAGDVLLLIGEWQRDDGGWLDQSLFLRVILSCEEGPPPPVDLEEERRHGDFVRGLIEAGRVRACHDVADGGLVVALAEMAMAGGIGLTLDELPPAIDPRVRVGWLFGEDQGRYVIAVDAAEAGAVLGKAVAAGITACRLGVVGGGALIIAPGEAISVETLTDIHESWLPAYMAA